MTLLELLEAHKRGDIPKDATLHVDNDYLELSRWDEEKDDKEVFFVWDGDPHSHHSLHHSHSSSHILTNNKTTYLIDQKYYP